MSLRRERSGSERCGGGRTTTQMMLFAIPPLKSMKIRRFHRKLRVILRLLLRAFVEAVFFRVEQNNLCSRFGVFPRTQGLLTQVCLLSTAARGDTRNRRDGL